MKEIPLFVGGANKSAHSDTGKAGRTQGAEAKYLTLNDVSSGQSWLLNTNHIDFRKANISKFKQCRCTNPYGALFRVKKASKGALCAPGLISVRQCGRGGAVYRCGLLAGGTAPFQRDPL